MGRINLVQLWHKWFPRRFVWNPFRTGWPPDLAHKVWDDPASHIGQQFKAGGSCWIIASWRPNVGGDTDPDDGLYTAKEVIK